MLQYKRFPLPSDGAYFLVPFSMLLPDNLILACFDQRLIRLRERS